MIRGVLQKSQFWGLVQTWRERGLLVTCSFNHYPILEEESGGHTHTHATHTHTHHAHGVLSYMLCLFQRRVEAWQVKEISQRVASVLDGGGLMGKTLTDRIRERRNSQHSSGSQSQSNSAAFSGQTCANAMHCDIHIYIYMCVYVIYIYVLLGCGHRFALSGESACHMSEIM